MNVKVEILFLAQRVFLSYRAPRNFVKHYFDRVIKLFLFSTADTTRHYDTHKELCRTYIIYLRERERTTDLMVFKKLLSWMGVSMGESFLELISQTDLRWKFWILCVGGQL